MSYYDSDIDTVLRGMALQTIYFSLRTIATLIEVDLVTNGVVREKDLPLEPIFASPRRT